jgi:hypothetical protein
MRLCATLAQRLLHKRFEESGEQIHFHRLIAKLYRTPIVCGLRMKGHVDLNGRVLGLFNQFRARRSADFSRPGA